MNSPYRIMKKILTTAVAAMLLLLSAAGAQAQEKRMHFGVKAGANFSTLNYNDYKSNPAALLLQTAVDLRWGGTVRQAVFLQFDKLQPAVGAQPLLILGDPLPHPCFLDLADGDNLYPQHTDPPQKRIMAPGQSRGAIHRR